MSGSFPRSAHHAPLQPPASRTVATNPLRSVFQGHNSPPSLAIFRGIHQQCAGWDRHPHLEKFELEDAAGMAEEELNFWASETIPEVETHIVDRDGNPWTVYEGDRWTSCGNYWTESTAIVDDQEPSCELCAIEWRYQQSGDRKAYEKEIDEHLSPRVTA